MSHFYDFVAKSGDGVFAVDREQTIVLWNAPAAEILGFSPEEVLGKKCYRVICGRNAQGRAVCREGCDTIRAARQLRPTPTTDVKARRKNGERVWLNVSTVLAPSQNEDLSAVLHLFRDATHEHDVLRAAENLAGIVSCEVSRNPTGLSRGSPRRQAELELTRREHEILLSLASGKSTDQIARKLCISSSTVRNHVSHILRKLAVHSRLEAVAYSIKTGLL